MYYVGSLPLYEKFWTQSQLRKYINIQVRYLQSVNSTLFPKGKLEYCSFEIPGIPLKLNVEQTGVGC